VQNQELRRQQEIARKPFEPTPATATPVLNPVTKPRIALGSEKERLHAKGCRKIQLENPITPYFCS
jgi:hypothetical protein